MRRREPWDVQYYMRGDLLVSEDLWRTLRPAERKLVGRITRCPDCGGPTITGEGVTVCTVCGWSKPSD